MNKPTAERARKVGELFRNFVNFCELNEFGGSVEPIGISQVAFYSTVDNGVDVKLTGQLRENEGEHSDSYLLIIIVRGDRKVSLASTTLTDDALIVTREDSKMVEGGATEPKLQEGQENFNVLMLHLLGEIYFKSFDTLKFFDEGGENGQ